MNLEERKPGARTEHEDVAPPERKEPWTAPVIVPLSCTVVTQHNPGVGSDGDPFPDSTLS